MCYLQAIFVYFDQCMFEAPSRKPTQMILKAVDPAPLQNVFCNHSFRHEILAGKLPSGRFKTAPAANYPDLLNLALATLILDSFELCLSRGTRFPFPSVEANGPAPRPCAGLPAGYAWGSGVREVQQGSRRLQN